MMGQLPAREVVQFQLRHHHAFSKEESYFLLLLEASLPPEKEAVDKLVEDYCNPQIGTEL
jgi:hypothetical protein